VAAVQAATFETDAAAIEAALWAVAHTAGMGQAQRDELGKAGAVAAVRGAMVRTTWAAEPRVMEAACWATRNLLMETKANHDAFVAAGIGAVFGDLLKRHFRDAALVAQAARALSWLDLSEANSDPYERQTIEAALITAMQRHAEQSDVVMLGAAALTNFLHRARNDSVTMGQAGVIALMRPALERYQTNASVVQPVCNLMTMLGTVASNQPLLEEHGLTPQVCEHLFEKLNPEAFKVDPDWKEPPPEVFLKGGKGAGSDNPLFDDSLMQWQLGLLQVGFTQR
jgi:hypothetical protein